MDGRETEYTITMFHRSDIYPYIPLVGFDTRPFFTCG